MPNDMSEEKWKDLHLHLRILSKKVHVKANVLAKDIPIGQKRKRGRPNKSSKALIID